MLTLSKQFNLTAEKNPEKVALIFHDQKIEYGRMHEAVKRLARGLQNIGIGKGDKVALHLPNVPHFPICYYAILELGATVVPINVMLQADDIEFYLKDSEVKALISWEGFRPQVMQAVAKCGSCTTVVFLGRKIPAKTISLQRLIAESNPIDSAIEYEANEVAVLVYTAGIADVPMAAEMTHSNLVSNASMCREMFMISPSERLIAVIPLFHPLGQTMVMNVAFLAGAGIVLQSKFSATQTVQLIAEHGVTFMAGVPGLYQALADLDVDKESVKTLRYCLSYGSCLDESVIQAFEEKFDALLLNSYGLSEAGPLVASCRLDRERKKDSVGQPGYGIEVRVFDFDGHELGSNQVGEIAVRGPAVTNGYYNKPEATQARFKEDWLLTGDVGKMDEDLYLFVMERKEDLILKGGFHIFPREVEAVLQRHPAVEDVAVLGVPDEKQGQEVKACIVLKEGAKANSKELIAYCGEQGLEVYKTPAHIDFYESLPKTITGRVLKRELREKLEEAKEFQDSTGMSTQSNKDGEMSGDLGRI